MTIVPEIASAVGIISIFLFLLRCYSTCKVVLAAVKLDSIINKADLITGGNTWYRERNGYRFSLVLHRYNTKKIKEISSVGSTFANKLVARLRQNLSEHSVQFVQELAYQLKLEESIKQMISADFVVMHRKLKCIPCFWTAKVITEAALSYGIPIVMHVQLKSKDRNYQLEHEIYLYFEATSSKYQNVCPSSLQKESPAIILLGSTCRDFSNLPSISDWTKEITTSGPVDLLLAYAAAHRQYPDETSEINIQDKEFEFYRKKAFEWGCCMQNSSRFFLSHAYCDHIENMLQESSKLE
ncbi:hypothetical protein TrispH2_009044 [Trichoplax sp. H2]|nr:hypothetical protein TrispH2_009044 [Trichoplax sp. H2]|eukprot:RDD39354.1 hypothetical protein TrispH2_009044 [Trichoplax sp. H2]